MQQIIKLVGDVWADRLYRVISNTWFIFILLVVLVSFFLAYRYPNMLLYPNYFAEDGSVFLQNIMNKGVLESFFTPFNGYFIVGLYALSSIAILFNSISGGDLLSLPTSFTLVGIVFLSAVMSLPYLLFSGYFGKVKMLIVVILSALMPLPQTPHAVIGIIGNQKFTFTYLAFLLVIYRLFRWRTLSYKYILSIDLILLVCLYTNSVVYLLIPVLLAPYIQYFVKSMKRRPFKSSIKSLLKQRGFISLLALFTFSIPQILYVALNGIPKFSGYLDTPYDTSKTIEIFGNRTLLYGLTHDVNNHLGDLRIIAILLIVVVGGWFVLRGKEKFVFFFGIYAALVSSVLFVLNRPGVSEFFFGYLSSGSGPDQFFFAQTLMMYMPIVLLVFSIGKLPKKFHIGTILIIVIFAGMFVGGLQSIKTHGNAWKHAGIYENSNDSLSDQVNKICMNNKPKKVFAYTPTTNDSKFIIDYSSQNLCATSSGLKNIQLTQQPLGLNANNNDYFIVTAPDQITQTFVANQNKLNGIKIFLSNFGKPFRSSNYSLVLYDNTCRKTLRTVEIPRTTNDSSYYRAKFDEIQTSSNQTFCISLKPPVTKVYDPIAVQFSKPNVYEAGQLRLNGLVSDKDILFSPLYSSRR